MGLEVYYKRQMDRNYMVIKGKDGVTEPDDEMRMLAENSIKGLMKLRIALVDCHLEYCYEISSMQPLARLYQKRKMGIEEIRGLFFSLQRQMEHMAPYLLDCAHLVLDPQWIYVQPQSFGVFLCYDTGTCRDFHQSLRELVQFVLEKLDHDHTGGVMTVYQMYQKSLEEAITVEDLLKVLLESGERMREEAPEEDSDSGLAQEIEESEESAKKMEGSEHTWTEEGTEALAKRAQNAHVLWHLDPLQNRIARVLAPLLFLGAAAIWFTLARLWGRAECFLGFVGATAIILLYLIWSVQRIRKERRDGKEAGERSVLSARQLISFSEGIVEEDKHPLPGETGPLQSKEEHALISQNPGRWNHIQLTQYPCTIGRSPDSCHIVLDFAQISRIHGEFQKKEDGIWLMDLNSSNGTYVNELRLEANTPVLIRPGDRICFGWIDYVFN